MVVADALDRVNCDQVDVAALYKHLPFGGVWGNRHPCRGRDQRASRRPEGLSAVMEFSTPLGVSWSHSTQSGWRTC